MKIELGKKYINASGKIIKTIYKANDITYCFRDQNGETYTKKGSVFDYKQDESDLICEIVPSIYTLYIVDNIEMKEFIELHIEYYKKRNEEERTR